MSRKIDVTSEREKGDIPAGTPVVNVNITEGNDSPVCEQEDEKASASFRIPKAAGIVSGLDGLAYNGRVTVILTGTVTELGSSWDEKSYHFDLKLETVSVKKAAEPEAPTGIDKAMAASARRASGPRLMPALKTAFGG